MNEELLKKIEAVEDICETMTLTITALPEIKKELEFMPRWEWGTLYTGIYDGENFINTSNDKVFNPFMDVSRWRMK